jgi:hypothetical protein
MLRVNATNSKRRGVNGVGGDTRGWVDSDGGARVRGEGGRDAREGDRLGIIQIILSIEFE